MKTITTCAVIGAILIIAFSGLKYMMKFIVEHATKSCTLDVEYALKRNWTYQRVFSNLVSLWPQQYPAILKKLVLKIIIQLRVFKPVLMKSLQKPAESLHLLRIFRLIFQLSIAIPARLDCALATRPHRLPLRLSLPGIKPVFLGTGRRAGPTGSFRCSVHEFMGPT